MRDARVTCLAHNLDGRKCGARLRLPSCPREITTIQVPATGRTERCGMGLEDGRESSLRRGITEVHDIAFLPLAQGQWVLSG